MRTINAYSVDDALCKGLELLRDAGVREDTRAGPALVAPWPVMTINHNPTYRVLFDVKRDANPFFHIMEALWMLAGRNDIVWLDQFVKDFSARFGEADGTMHGAYGHRWRVAFGFDQLDIVIAKLKKNSNDRQAVIQMWDGSRGTVLGYGDLSDDLQGDWKDRPCNTHIYLRVRDEPNNRMGEVVSTFSKVLDLTVCCRSNDAVMGAHGANAVHFSVLQEYLAARIGVGIGTLYQLSNNYHVYMSDLEKIWPLAVIEGYSYEENISPTKIVSVPDAFDADLALFFSNIWDKASTTRYVNPFFDWVAVPFRKAYSHWRAGEREQARVLVRHPTTDWAIAAHEWFQRKHNKGVG